MMMNRIAQFTIDLVLIILRLLWPLWKKSKYFFLENHFVARRISIAFKACGPFTVVETQWLAAGSACGDATLFALMISARLCCGSWFDSWRLFRPCILSANFCSSVTAFVDSDSWSLLPRWRHYLLQDAEVRYEAGGSSAPRCFCAGNSWLMTSIATFVKCIRSNNPFPCILLR